jgi:hypothetical protein
MALYRSELEVIESAYAQERKAHLEQCQTEMQQLFDRRSQMEQDFMERYLSMVENYQRQLFDLQVLLTLSHSTAPIIYADCCSSTLHPTEVNPHGVVGQLSCKLIGKQEFGRANILVVLLILQPFCLRHGEWLADLREEHG